MGAPGTSGRTKRSQGCGSHNTELFTDPIFVLVLLRPPVPLFHLYVPRRLGLNSYSRLSSGREVLLLDCWAMTLTLTFIGDSLYSLTLCSALPYDGVFHLQKKTKGEKGLGGPT